MSDKDPVFDFCRAFFRKDVVNRVMLNMHTSHDSAFAKVPRTNNDSSSKQRI